MNEIELVALRHKKRRYNDYTEIKEDNKISKIFTKILLSTILVLASTIYIKLSPENLAFFKSHVFESNITFTKINNWYHKTFGSILPSFQEPNTTTVSENLETTKEKEKYYDGYKLYTDKNTPIKNITSGLLVYMGEKENYGNVAIIQGVDGVDIWYGGLIDMDLKMYDYVETNTILGNTEEEYYYLLFVKDDKYITYEEYINQI